MPGLNHGFEYRRRLGVEALGLNVLEYLVIHYSRFTREEWLNRMESNLVLLDGVPPKQNALLKPGQSLSWLRPPWEEPEAPRAFAILYQDDHMIAVAKPRGLPTLPGGGDFMNHTLLSLVRRHYPGANPLHRLGRGTSGVVLFSRTPEASSRISPAWCRGEVLKVYRALATGCPARNEFEVDIPIGTVPHPLLKSLHAASLNGKSAHSHIRVLERRPDCSLLEVRITTGRPHQIRIHLAAAGHPLIGDPLYVVGGAPAQDSRALPGEGGYSLHAALLGFMHPTTGSWIEITCMPPPVLRLPLE